MASGCETIRGRIDAVIGQASAQLRPNIIKQRIQDFETRLNVDEIGTVLTVGDGVARVFGLKNVMAGELVEFENGVKGMVLNLESNNVGVAILSESSGIKEGSTVKRTEKSGTR